MVESLGILEDLRKLLLRQSEFFIQITSAIALAMLRVDVGIHRPPVHTDIRQQYDGKSSRFNMKEYKDVEIIKEPCSAFCTHHHL